MNKAKGSRGMSVVFLSCSSEANRLPVRRRSEVSTWTLRIVEERSTMPLKGHGIKELINMSARARLSVCVQR